jgi:L-asparagine oxygenase
VSAVSPTGLGVLDQSEIVDIDPEAVHDLHAHARMLASGREPQALAEQGAALVSALAPAVLRRLHRFAAVGSPNNTVLLRGLLPDLPDLQPTPDTTTPAGIDDMAQAAALSLLAVGCVLGEPFTFAALYEGRLVQHVVPVPGQETAQTSEGSAALAWHVEDAFSDDRCDYVGLLCLRGQPGAATLVAPARALRLPAHVEHVLRQERFVIVPDLAHGIEEPDAAPAAPVLSGPRTDPEICFEAVYQRPADPSDTEARKALDVLAVAVEQAAVGHVLRAGELLIVDNRRVVHGRTVFTPRYDGADRWLQRVMVCADGRAHRRRHGNRALH